MSNIRQRRLTDIRGYILNTFVVSITNSVYVSSVVSAVHAVYVSVLPRVFLCLFELVLFDNIAEPIVLKRVKIVSNQ